MQYQSRDLAMFPNQVDFAYEHYSPHKIRIKDLNGIVIGGLGGSGIAGRLVAAHVQDLCPVPVQVISDYNLPGWADKNTLVIASSYSGNTEETLEMYEEASGRQAKLLALTTGGKLGELAKRDKVPVYSAEEGYQPRMALGYSLTYLLLIMETLLDTRLLTKREKLVSKFRNQDHFMQSARSIFNKFKSGIRRKFVIITDRYTGPVGIRFAQQIQENAKGEAFVHELPESNHNVIESYYGLIDSNFIFLNGKVHDRIEMRFDFLQDVLRSHNNLVYRMDFNGKDLHALLEIIYVLDWFSLMTADKKGINSIEIPNIKSLKNFLETKMPRNR